MENQMKNENTTRSFDGIAAKKFLSNNDVSEKVRRVLDDVSEMNEEEAKMDTINKTNETYEVQEIDENTQFVSRGRETKYPFAELDTPGKGFYFSIDKIKAIQAAASNYSVRHKDFKFTVRTIDRNRGVVIRKKLG